MKTSLGHLIDCIDIHPSSQKALDEIKLRLEINRPVTISFINAHAVNLAFANPAFKQALESSEFLFRDGIGVKLLLTMAGRNAGYNLNGTDLIPQLLDKVFAGKRIAILGSRDNELQIAGKKIAQYNLEVVCIEHGFSDYDHYLALIDQCKPDVVLLAMGMPKQELLSQQINQQFPSISVINGGAIIDFMANKYKRSPKIMRRFGMEWVYRLVNEPKRLFKRYTIGNLIFIFRVLHYRLTVK